MKLDEDYSDAGFRKRFMSKEPGDRDQLETQFIEAGVQELATKLLKQLSKEPKEFQRKVALEVARQSIE
jgi:hypothetical protein